jgi:hypothetical protein
MIFPDLFGSPSLAEFFEKSWMKVPTILSPTALPTALQISSAEVLRLFLMHGNTDARFTSYSREAQAKTSGRVHVVAAFDAPDLPDVALEELARREALIIRDLETMPPFDVCCEDVRRFWKSHVSLNCYCIRPGADHFPPHQDGHHIFAIQLEGRKRWYLHPPSQLLPMSYYKRTKEHPTPESATVIDVSPGQILYLPVGWVHHAETLEGASVHLSLGVRPLRWVDFLKELCELAGASHSPLRDYLPFAITTEGVSYPADLVEDTAKRLRLLSLDLASNCATLADYHSKT